ncbi:MAG: UxaA family hydrolase, partial [Niveispirillum sp.]
LHIHAADGVGVALRDLAAGEPALGTTTGAAIPRGHKFALRAHRAGEVVTKYGQPIGVATSAIAPGDHVHSHNLVTALDG